LELPDYGRAFKHRDFLGQVNESILRNIKAADDMAQKRAFSTAVCPGNPNPIVWIKGKFRQTNAALWAQLKLTGFNPDQKILLTLFTDQIKCQVILFLYLYPSQFMLRALNSRTKTGSKISSHRIFAGKLCQIYFSTAIRVIFMQPFLRNPTL
jgi:hypothetical protein